MNGVTHITVPGNDEGISLDPDSAFPLIYTPARDGGDVIRWASQNAEQLKSQLHQNGAILFRGFKLKPDTFTALARTICPNLFTEYGDLTAEDLGDEVYSSTAYPVEHPIHFHNESAPAAEWPLYMFFYCNRRALEGGATRMASTRKILAELDPATRDHFRQHPLVYSRNHYPNVDTSWQHVYGVDDPREVEQRCRADGLHYEWKNRDTLHTTAVVPSVIRHPRTDEEVFFHQLFLYHPSCLDKETRRSLESIYHEIDMPRMIHSQPNKRLNDEVVQKIFSLYEKHAVEIDWHVGDVVMMDNALVAHGRTTFRGPRHILVAMGDMIQNELGTVAESVTGVQAPDLSQPILEIDYVTVPATILAVANKTPDAIAITQDGKTWTYRDLELQARRMAGVLQERGLRCGETVAITGLRGFDVIAGMLGAWLNGNVTLPIDAELPKARQALMMKEASARFVLTADILPENSVGSIHLPEVSSSAPAYIFFTSGSTGQPKGILGTHNALAHFLQWQRDTFKLMPGDRVAHLTSLSFDVVLRDIFLPLTSGATLCIPPEDSDKVNPWPWLNREQITRMHAVPSLASVWLDNAVPCHSLKTVFFAGEPLNDTLIRRWRSIAAACDVINLYGPTETTLAKCWHRIPDTPEPGVQPIGYPLPGVQILILNEQKEACAQGKTGQIVIRTPYRARGYLRPESGGFETNPFCDDTDDLLYFTGDLGRFRSDGALDILGRQDDQVKILGVRIEPQEVAATLSSHPEIRQAFVTTNESTPPGLLAYVVANENSLTGKEITTWLSGLLPSSLLPRQYIYLDKMPLTPTGKVDRKNLPRPTRAAREPARKTTVPPPSEIVQPLTEFWQDLLKKDAIDLKDNFFDHGGHSLMAVQLVSRVRDVFHVSFGMNHVFENPVLADMAWCIAHLPSDSPDAMLKPIPRVNHSQPLALSFSQERLWFLSQLDPDKGHYNIPGSIRITGPLDLGRIQDCVDELVARHASLRTYFLSTDGTPRQVIAEQAKLLVEPSALLNDAREIVKQPFDLTVPPLARARLIKISEHEHILAYALHHTIADGWSNFIFNRELQLLYAKSTLPALSVAYADYAQWERERFRESTHRQLDYWEKQLAGAPTLLNLPTDWPRPTVQMFNSGSCSCTLSPSLTQSIRTALPGASATLFMKLLAVFKLLLHQLSGDRDLCVGTPVARRDRRDLESVMGCFINTLVLRTRLSPDQTFESLLAGIREQTLEAFVHPDAPFEKVVERLHPPRNPGHHPLFQVLFNYLTFEEPTTTTSGTILQREWLVDPETKFDMTLYVREQKDCIRLHLVYNADLFNTHRMEELLQSYQRLTEACVAFPHKQLSEFEGAVDGTRTQAAPSEPSCEPDYVSATENPLTKIWCDVLKLPTVGRRDNFFALGGHSLLVVQLTTHMRIFFEVQIPLRSVFQYPTVAELAREIDRLQNSVPLPSGALVHEDTLTVAQQRLWQLHRLGLDSHFYNVPRAFQLVGKLDIAALQSALDTVVKRHEMLRTIYEGDADHGSSKVLSSSIVPIQVLDLSGLSIAEQKAQEKERIEQDMQHQFDLTRDLPLHCTLVRRDEEEHTLIVTVHHIAADCWSMGMAFGPFGTVARSWMAGSFFREFWDCYHGVALPKPVQFSDVSRQQVAWLSSEEAVSQFNYWKSLLEDRPKPTEIPPDFERPPIWDYSGERLPICIDPEIVAAVRNLSRQNETTVFVVLLAAYSALLRGLTGQEDIVTGTTVSNRTRWAAEDVIGMFSNNLPLRIQLTGDMNFQEIIRRSHAAAFGALSHQEFPFERMAEMFETKPVEDRHALFQNRFLLHTAVDKSLSADDLEMIPVPIGREVAKCDFTLRLADDGVALDGWLEYATSLYRRETAEKIMSQYQRLLSTAVTNPNLLLSTLSRSL